MPACCNPRVLHPPERLGFFPGSLQPWGQDPGSSRGWSIPGPGGAASAEARGGLSAAGLCWGLVPGRELPGHWQVMSLPLRLSPFGPRRASPRRTRECALLDSGKYSGHLQIKARRSRGGVGGGSSCSFTGERQGGGAAEETQAEAAAGEGTLRSPARLAGHSFRPPASGLGHRARELV